MVRMVCGGAFAPRQFPRIFIDGSSRARASARLAALALVAGTLGGCASSQSVVSSGFSTAPGRSAGTSTAMFPESKWGVSASRRVAGPRDYIPKGGGVYKVGSAYQVGGRWYKPREQPDYDRIGIASWYGSDFHGRKTANGEIFDMHALTAAHPTLPLPSYVYVTNLANNRTILVRVNDRGPYVGERMIDLSKRSADVLSLKTGGTGRVRVRYAGPAPLDGDDRRERQFLASRAWNGAMDIAAVERAESSREWSAHRRGPAPRSYAAAPLPSAGMSYGQRPERRSYAAASFDQGGAWSPSQYRAAIASR